jgi:DNA-binding GntR family transcriptional regulator
VIRMLDGLQIPRQTITERVADELRQRILAGTIRPGTPLTEDALARSIGVSRSTIREALAMLASEGLLTRSASRRVLQVTELSEDDVADIFTARRLFEFAALGAAASASPTDRERFERAIAAYSTAVQRQDVLSLVEADLECHIAEVALLGSQRLTGMYEGLMQELRLAFALTEVAEQSRDELALHQEFYRLLLSGRISEAREQLSTRLDASEASLKALVRETRHGS